MLKQILLIFLGVIILNPLCCVLAKPILVNSIKVKDSSVQHKLTATGTLIAIPGTAVRSEVAGRIAKVYFKSGEDVVAGAPLVTINSTSIRAQLVQVRAEQKLAKLAFTRALQLNKKHYIAKSDFDKMRANLVIAQAKVAQIKAQLQTMIIAAPFSGRLGLAMISVGDYVNAGQDIIVNLQQLNPISVDFSISEVYLSQVAVGQMVLLNSDAYPNKIFTGKVVACESKIKQTNRTLMVRASVPNKGNKLLPGMFVEVTLLINTQHHIIKVPQVAVASALNGNYVYKVQHDRAKKTKVVLGERNGQTVIIHSGLKVGDKIITDGQFKVHDGAVIKDQEN